MELFWWGIFADCTMGKSHLNRHLGYYLGTFASILCKSKFGWPWLGKSIVKNPPLVRRIFILIRVSVCPWVWFNDLFWLLGGSLKWWGETPTTISFPTKNDQHLGNEMGGNPPFQETPISFCRMVVGWSLGCQYPVIPCPIKVRPLEVHSAVTGSFVSKMVGVLFQTYPQVTISFRRFRMSRDRLGTGRRMRATLLKQVEYHQILASPSHRIHVCYIYLHLP